jgi:hypothetical protein
MTSLIPAVFVAMALGLASPVLADTQIPETEPSGPPVKIKVAEPAPTTVSSPGSAVERAEEPPEPAAQRGSGGSRGGGPGGSRGGGNGASRGGWNGGHPGGGSPRRGSGSHGWWGPSPVYFARPYYYDPFWVSGAFGWSPMFYAPWSLMWATGGYGPYPWFGSTTFNTGGLRLKMKPRDAQVFIDGAFAGVVDDFDGIFQSLRLAPGGHKLEVRMPGFETLVRDVHIQPDRTMTFTEAMTPNP